MEQVMLRIPFLAESIFAEADNKTLANCKIVGETWASFIDMKKVKWFRIILKYAENMTEFSDHWKILMGRTPVKIVEETALTIEEFFRANLKRKDYQWSPFVIAADRGRLELYQYIAEKLTEKDPAQVHQTIALEFAAMAGHLEVCKFIISSLAEKNLRLDIFLITSLHCAARYGQLEVFKLLTESVSDKNPQCHLGWTPLHEAASGGRLKYLKIKDYMWAKLNLAAVFDVFEHDGALPLTISAAESGHLKICQYLIANVIDKNPINNVQNVPSNITTDGPTVLHVAAWFGQFEACKLIMESVENKNPRNGIGRTPLQLAAEAGHLEICQLLIDNIEDKNPGNPIYNTPLAAAIGNGHLQICKLIMNNIEGPEVADKEWLIGIGIRSSQLEVCEFLIDGEKDSKSYCKPISRLFFFSLLAIMFPEEFFFLKNFKWHFSGLFIVPSLVSMVFFSPLLCLLTIVVDYRRSSEFFASNPLFVTYWFVFLYFCLAMFGCCVLIPKLQPFVKQMKGLQT